MTLSDAHRLRPFATLDETTERILRVAYDEYMQGEQVSGARLRFEAKVDHQKVQRLVDPLHLLIENGQRYRPTVLGLLYFDDALAELEALDRLLVFAREKYRPEQLPLAAAKVMAGARIDLEQLKRFAMFASPELPLLLAGVRVQLTEACLDEGSLEALVEALRRKWLPNLHQHVGWDPADKLPPFLLRPRRLSVAGFRVLRALDVDLAPLTVLVGPNGVGKSTLLDVFGFLRTTARSPVHAHHQGLAGALAAEGGLDRLRSSGARTPLAINLSFALHHGSSGDPTLGSYDLELGELGADPIVEREALSVTDGGRTKRLIAGGHGRAECLMKSGKTEAVYLGSNETALGVDRPDGAPLIDQIRSALARVSLLDREIVRPARSPFLARANSRRRETLDAALVLELTADNPSLLAKLGEYLRELVPTLEAVDVNRLTGEPAALVFREREQPGLLTFDELSAGTRQLVLLAAIAVAPSQPTFLLVEEPDAAVHPGAHGALVALLRSLAERTTILATTHSPAFIGRLDPTSEVRALTRDENGAHAEPLAKALASQAWLADFGSTAEAFTRSTQVRRP